MTSAFRTGVWRDQVGRRNRRGRETTTVYPFIKLAYDFDIRVTIPRDSSHQRRMAQRRWILPFLAAVFIARAITAADGNVVRTHT